MKNPFSCWVYNLKERDIFTVWQQFHDFVLFLKWRINLVVYSAYAPQDGVSKSQSELNYMPG